MARVPTNDFVGTLVRNTPGSSRMSRAYLKSMIS